MDGMDGHRKSALIRSVSKWKPKWRPPVFKLGDRGSGVAGRILTSAISMAVAVTAMDIVDDIILSDNTVAMSKAARRAIGFVAAFVAGVFSYLLMWFLFGSV
jgi:hypothetical protein